VVIQARTGSTRLPGKVLLPLGDVPLAVLCAKRAATTGREVVLAIPAGSDDDALARVATAHGVAFRRGSLHDVLSRFIAAIDDMDDDDVVVRLTADNPLPDGPFVEFAVGSLLKCDVPYVGPEFGAGGFPHGLSAEAFRAGALRTVARSSSTDAVREHVTSGLRKQVSARLSATAVGIPPIAQSASCSIDRGSDYVTLRNLFAAVDDPVGEPWRGLLDRLLAGPPPAFQVKQRAVVGALAGEMSLGTAQLGMPYGIANRAGQPDAAAAADIVATARMCGVTYFDTARTYGDSERLLGEALDGPIIGAAPAKVVTKLPGVPSAMSRSKINEWVRQTVAESATSLRRSKLDVLLLHRWQDRTRSRGAVWGALRVLRSEGAVGELGASVQTVTEGLAALRDPDVRHVQLPANVLDWRWRSREFLQARIARHDVAVHARSSLLQGVLLLKPELWPGVDGVSAPAVSRRLHELVEECGRSSVTDLAFAYVRSLRWVDTVVVGAERVDQLIANVELFRRPALTSEQARRVEEALPAIPESFLNPALWPQTSS
jgi:spore coat polysaccharide biosynthesis protein SpsF